MDKPLDNWLLLNPLLLAEKGVMSLVYGGLRDSFPAHRKQLHLVGFKLVRPGQFVVNRMQSSW